MLLKWIIMHTERHTSDDLMQKGIFNDYNAYFYFGRNAIRGLNGTLSQTHCGKNTSMLPSVNERFQDSDPATLLLD